MTEVEKRNLSGERIQMEGYKTSLEHLIDELRRIELKIRLQVLRFRMLGRVTPDEFKGLCITEEEINSILSPDPFESERPVAETEQLNSLQSGSYRNWIASES